VSVGASLFAHGFRKASFFLLGQLSGTDDPTSAADRSPPVTFALVATVTVAAAVIGHWTVDRHRDRLGADRAGGHGADRGPAADGAPPPSPGRPAPGSPAAHWCPSGGSPPYSKPGVRRWRRRVGAGPLQIAER